MEIEEALKIMRALANGANPETGDALTGPASYALQSPKAVTNEHEFGLSLGQL